VSEDELIRTLASQGIRRVVIIDDAYDEEPTASSVEERYWNFFLEDLSDVDLTLIGREFDVFDKINALYRLRGSDDFVKFLWTNRGVSTVFSALFEGFTEAQRSGRAGLKVLEDYLKDLGLDLSTCGTGADAIAAGTTAELVFVDLFLGATQDEAARQRAVDRIRRVIAGRPSNPPLIVVISASSRLELLRDWCRDSAGLLGSQFRTLAKQDAGDRVGVSDILIRLASTYRNTVKLATFIESWRSALDSARDRFLTKIRLLDLRDYADIQQLLLDAEGTTVGSHLLETYDHFFHFELEGDQALRDAGRALNEIDWTDYPRPQFLPAPVTSEIVDGLLFHRAEALSTEAAYEFGDVYFIEESDRLLPVTWPQHAPGERLAMVLLTQSCDVAQGKAQRLLFMTGVARSSSIPLHQRPNPLTTPILNDGSTRYVISWELGAPLAVWSPTEFAQLVKGKAVRRTRRFRTVYALQLQQLFAANMTRVGLPVMLPPHHYVGVEVIAKIDGDAHRLFSVSRLDRQAVALVGRDKGTKPKDILHLSTDFSAQLRQELAKIDAERLTNKQMRLRWKNAVVRIDVFLGLLEAGLEYDRNGAKRPFDKTDYDVVQIVGSAYPNPEAKVADNQSGPLLLVIAEQDDHGAASDIAGTRDVPEGPS
jgi:hypothetical protein